VRLTLRTRKDGPGHELCMLFSALVCPFFATPNSRRKDSELRGRQPGDVGALLGFELVQLVMGQDQPHPVEYSYSRVVDRAPAQASFLIE
jgi:hypothetical protein